MASKAWWQALIACMRADISPCMIYCFVVVVGILDERREAAPFSSSKEEHR